MWVAALLVTGHAHRLNFGQICFLLGVSQASQDVPQLGALRSDQGGASEEGGQSLADADGQSKPQIQGDSPKSAQNRKKNNSRSEE